MKKYIYFILFAAVMISSCNKFEEFPKDTVDVRLNQSIADLEKTLISSPEGWKGFLLTGKGDAKASFKIQFDDKNRVITTATYKTDTVVSSYRLKALQLPTLIFDTYSLMHLLVDPDPSVFRGEAGDGFISDFEFGVTSIDKDIIHLTGLSNKSKLILVRATEATSVKDIRNEEDKVGAQLKALKTYFARTTIDGIEYEFSVDNSEKIVGFQYIEDGQLKSHSSQYYVNKGELYFFDPIKLGKKTYKGINSIVANSTNNTIDAKLDDQPFVIEQSTKPLLYNGFAQKFIDNPPLGGFAAINYTGFTVDGKEDGLGVTTIPGFDAIIYFPTFDGEIFFRRNKSVGSGNLFQTTYTIKDGIVYYTLGKVTYDKGESQDAIDKIKKTLELFTSKDGLYVIQVSKDAYDLVSAKDASFWIRMGN